MNIVLVCAMGASTGVMVNKMKKVVKTDDSYNVGKVEAISTEDFEDRVDEFDVVLLGPQIRYKEAEFKNICEPKNIAVSVIDSRAYGMMDAKSVLDQAGKLVG